MSKKQEHKEKLSENRLMRIENRLKRIEILLLKNISGENRISKDLKRLEKEEKLIEKEQRKLEKEEEMTLKEMGKVEKEEEWHLQIQYNCSAKVMEDTNTISCSRTKQACEMAICPRLHEMKE